MHKIICMLLPHLSTSYGNPEIPEAQPHLCIKKFLLALQNVTSTPDYQKYLQQKLC